MTEQHTPVACSKTEPATQLKPCPHCGKQPRLTHHSNRFDGKKLVSLRCCASIFGTPEEVEAKWNARLPAEQQRAELLALVVECDKWLDGRLTAIKGGDHLHAQMKSIIANTQELKP